MEDKNALKRSMPKRLRPRWPWILVLLSCLAFAVLWQILPKNGLLDRATLLVTRDKWLGPERRNGEVGNYAWLTKDELLLFQRNPDKTVTLLRKKVLPLGTVSAATSLPVAPLAQPKSVMLSPDRMTLHVMYNRRNTPSKHGMASEFVALRDGRTSGLMPGWVLGTDYEGTNSVCECEYDKDNKLTATLHYYDGRKDEEIVVNGATGAPLRVGNVWPLFIEPSGRVVAVSDSEYDGVVTTMMKATLGLRLSPVRTFVEFNLKDPNREAKVWTVPVPDDAACFSCEPSPRHDRLLWIVQSNRMPPLAAITQKLPGFLKRPARYLCRWMVSDLEGHHMHTLTEFEISDLFYNRPDLISPQWTPDGQHVSFEYKSALYLMNVDEDLSHQR